MATFESPQYERDLRSAHKEWKRVKDSNVKWSHGTRHLPGITLNVYGDPVRSANLSEAHLAKQRPGKQFSSNPYKSDKNLTKCRTSWQVPDARVRSKLFAKTEIRDVAASSSLARRLSASTATTTITTTDASSPSPSAAAATSADPFLYSFDRADSPNAPLTLEVFVKPATPGRDTERLVEREYEVLDGNGEAVRGRRARRVLRAAGSASGTAGGSRDRGEEREEDDDGFELV